MNDIVSAIAEYGLAYFAVLTVISMLGLRGGSNLRKKTKEEMVFQSSRPMRLTVIMTAILLIGIAPLFLTSIALTPTRHPTSAGVWIFFTLLSFLSVCFGVHFLWIASPWELRLDLQQRTYRHTKGWPFNRKVTSGASDDIKGVRVTRGTSSGIYFVFLTWQGDAKRSLALGQFSRRDRADLLAGELASALGLPVIPPTDGAKVAISRI